MTKFSSRRRALMTSKRRALIVANNLSPFANILVRSGFVNSDRMQQALIESRKSRKPLTQVLQELTGKQLPPDLIRAYKKQHLFELKILYGVEAIDPEISQIDTTQVNELIDTLIPIDICRRYQLVPLSKKANPPSVFVAMVDPDNLAAWDDMKRVLRPQGLGLQRMVITQEDYEQIISKYLDEVVRRFKPKVREQKLDLDIDLTHLDTSMEEVGDDVYEGREINLDAALKDPEIAPVIQCANSIMARGITYRASDIYIEPQAEDMRVRFRINGILQEPFPRFPKSITQALTNRFKIIGNLDIIKQNVPQTGSFRRIYQKRKFDFRIAVSPGVHGDSIVLRILDNSALDVGLDKLITDPDTCQQVRSLGRRQSGLILVTGTVGSGKSTTIYSFIGEKDREGLKVTTIEEPIEATLPRVLQVEVNRKKGITFESALPMVLRQVPDLIVIGEIRDIETAKVAIEAANSCLVIASLSSSGAGYAIARLQELGVSEAQIARSLIGVINQCLLRRVCPECRISYKPTGEQLNRLGLSPQTEQLFYRANSLVDDEEKKRAKELGELCPNCQGVGYTVRIGAYEVLPVNQQMRRLISQGMPEIEQVAIESGMKTISKYSLDLVLQGMTTLEEVEGVIGWEQQQLSLDRKWEEEKEQLERGWQEEKQQLEREKAKLEQELLNVRSRDIARLETSKTKLEQQVKNIKKQRAEMIWQLIEMEDLFALSRIKVKPQTEGELAINQGYQLIYRHLVEKLKRLGVTAISAKGKPFDPNFHEAAIAEPTDDYPEGTVIAEIKRGFLVRDRASATGYRLLRPALVKVAVPIP